MNKLKESLVKVNNKYLKENTAKQLFKLFSEASEYVDPNVAAKIQQIIDLLKQEDHTNMHSRQKFVDLLYQLTELENDSDDRRTSVRKFFKYVSRAITDYEEDIADDSDILGENKNKEQIMKLKEAEKWSGDVETKKHPPEDLFSTGSAEDIAKWAKSSHKDLQSAMGALNFYINRAGSNISTEQKNKVETAKDKLSKMYENKLDNLKNVIAEAKKRIGEAAIKMSDYFDAEKRLQFYLKDKEDSTADDFANAVVRWARKNNIVPIEDTKHNEDYDINIPGFDDTKDKFRTLAIIEIKNEYVKDFIRWLKIGEGRLYLS